jgi:hypothetical protein
MSNEVGQITLWTGQTRLAHSQRRAAQGENAWMGHQGDRIEIVGSSNFTRRRKSGSKSWESSSGLAKQHVKFYSSVSSPSEGCHMASTSHRSILVVPAHSPCLQEILKSFQTQTAGSGETSQIHSSVPWCKTTKRSPEVSWPSVVRRRSCPAEDEEISQSDASPRYFHALVRE